MASTPNAQIDSLTAQLRQRDAATAASGAQARAAQRAKYVVFQLADEWYGIPAGQVRAISRAPTITRLPGAPAHILGVANLSATAITAVLDIRPTLGLRPRPEMPQTPDLRLIVLSAMVDERAELPGDTTTATRVTLTVAIVADLVSEVKEFASTQIEPPLATLDGSRAELIGGVARIATTPVTLLDPIAILTRFRL